MNIRIMKIKLATTLLLLGLSSPVMAGVWSSGGTINSVTSHNGTHIVVTTITANECGSAGKFWWPANDPDAKDMLSIALAAMMSQKEIAIVYDQSTPNCQWNGQLGTHIKISN